MTADTSGPGEASWSPAQNLYSVALSEAQQWNDTVHLIAKRMLSDPVDAQLYARVFLLALRQILYSADLEQHVIEQQSPSASKALRAARVKFEHSVPGLTDARNIIVHFDKYAQGSGNLQRDPVKKGMSPTRVAHDFWPFGYDPHTGNIQVGPYQINVENAVAEARMLLHAIWEAARTIDTSALDRGIFYRQEFMDSSTISRLYNPDQANCLQWFEGHVGQEVRLTPRLALARLRQPARDTYGCHEKRVQQTSTAT